MPLVQVQTKMQKQHLEQCTAVRPEEREPGDEVDDDAAEDEEADVQLAQIHASKVLHLIASHAVHGAPGTWPGGQVMRGLSGGPPEARNAPR